MKKSKIPLLYVTISLLLIIALSFSAFANNVVSPSSEPQITEDDLYSRLPPRIRDKINPKETVATSASTVHNWYCRHMKDGKIPPCPSEMSFISECGGYFIGSPEEKVIYLTFDAGYENGNIAKILDVMKEKGVSGAFFVLSNLVKRNEDLVRRMADEGHLVCNHTSSHKDMSTADRDTFTAELGALEASLKNIGVECAPFYRPPEGKFCRNNLDWAQKLGYSTIFWSFAYADWDNASQPDPNSAKAKILSGTHSGMVLLLHPTSSTNAEILGALIDSWRAEGYSFGSLTDLVK